MPWSEHFSTPLFLIFQSSDFQFCACSNIGLPQLASLAGTGIGFVSSLSGKPILQPEFTSISPESNLVSFSLVNFLTMDTPNFDDQSLLHDNLSYLDPNPNNPTTTLSSSFSREVDDEFSDSMLKYINQVLMEEDIDSKPDMFHDLLTLQATAESLYEVIRGGNGSSSPDQNPLCVNQIDSSDSGSSSSQSFESGTINSDFSETRSCMLQNPIPENFVFQSTSRSMTQLSSNENASGNGNRKVGSYRSELLVPNVISNSEFLVQFNRGAQEGNKFLPKGQLISGEGNKPNAVMDRRAEDIVGSVGLGIKKNHQREDIDVVDGRSKKQLAVYLDDEEEDLTDIFKKVLISKDDQVLQNEAHNGLQQDAQFVGIGNGKAQGKDHGNMKEVIDLRALLNLCAQAVSVDDRGSASELLKQIMRHSSPFGDSTQRLAHCFGNALEARLAGTGTQIYTALSSKEMPVSDMLTFYRAYIAACPFMKMSMIFANHTILKAAEKAETLHIIDFGIHYGFQWPALIHCLSRRPGGPPKLCITGVETIDLPLSGFRPEERVQMTGHRLAKYCKRFNVPFEYHPIAQKWETIQFEDLKVQRNEVLAVNCLCRFKFILDETVVINSPRDTVLNLINKMKPDVFVHSEVNGSYHAPFFISRFRQALFHFSAFFDMFDTILPREDQMRLVFERVFIRREVVNVVACEGSERNTRPEVYKQWQVRNMRAGFRQLPLDREVVKIIKDKVKTGYHPDFVVDEYGHWLLYGWKGRTIFASACWTPSRT